SKRSAGARVLMRTVQGKRKRRRRKRRKKKRRRRMTQRKGKRVRINGHSRMHLTGANSMETAGLHRPRLALQGAGNGPLCEPVAVADHQAAV
ncbi:MAG: hypothetical protein ACK4F6_19230, partial [Hylemonella sp.]